MENISYYPRNTPGARRIDWWKKYTTQYEQTLQQDNSIQSKLKLSAKCSNKVLRKIKQTSLITVLLKTRILFAMQGNQ